MTESSFPKTRADVPAETRVASVVSLVLGITALIYWVPALIAPPSGEVSYHPVAFVQRVASMALEQYTPNMRPVVPVLGGLFSLASVVQIPAALGSLVGHPRFMAYLRGVAYSKIGLYVMSGLLLGLAIFSSIRAGDPSWTFSAANWLANLAMIGVYYWIAMALVPGEDEPAGEQAGEEAEEPEEAGEE